MLFSLATAALLLAAPDAVPPELAAIGTPYEATLKNGLRVRLLKSDAVPTVSYYTFFRVGSRNERLGITGISHLFEHMMFNGAKKYGPGAFDEVLEGAGGYSNASTTEDFTTYYESFAAEALEKVIDLESDRMRSLAISDRMLASERGVVLEERRTRIDNDLHGLLDEQLNALAYLAHPYHWPVAGWTKDVERITRDECQQYFRTYYAPNNATLWVVGDFDPPSLMAKIQAAYSDIPRGPAPAPVLDAEPEQLGERRAVVRHAAQAPSIVIGYKGPVATDPDTLVLDVLEVALGVGEGSRLTRELVYQRQLAIEVATSWPWRIDPGLFSFDLRLRPDSKPAEVEAAFDAELQKVVDQGLTDAELTRAKNTLRADMLYELETNAGRAQTLGLQEELLGDWRSALAVRERYAAITSEQVKAAAKKYFRRDHRTVVTLLPEGGK